MYNFNHIKDGQAVFTDVDSAGERRYTCEEIKAVINALDGHLAKDESDSDPFFRMLQGFCRDSRREFIVALEAFEALNSAPQVSAEPKGVKDAPSSPAAAASAFAQTAAPSGGEKRRYQFAGIGNGSMETYLFRDGVCIKKSSDPSVFEELLSECSPDDIGPVRAAAKATRVVQELLAKGKNPLGSGKLKKLLVFQGIDNDGRKPKAVFAFYNGRTGENEPPFRKTLPELKRSTAGAADYGEYEAAIKALEALGNENALSAPAVPERGAQPSAGLSKGGRRFDFLGSAENFEEIMVLETLDRGVRAYNSSNPKIFAALLRNCHPDSIGPLRAAMVTAMLIQCARETGENPRDVIPGEVRVFAGVGKGVFGEDCARFQVYNVHSGEEKRGRRSSCFPGDLRYTRMQGAFDFPLEEKEIQAAIEALKALGNEKAPSSRVAATQPEARRPFSRGAGAVDAPETPKASVRYTGVVTELRKGLPHAEAGFRDTSAFAGTARTGGSEKTWLTAEQIEEKIASLAEGHPDRAVYEAALKQVEQKNEELGSAPVRVMDEYRPR